MSSHFELNCLTKTEQSLLLRIRVALESPCDRFLVGGLVRDALLRRSREKIDFDLISPDPKGDLSRLQSQFGGKVISLDENLGIYRLVLNPNVYIDMARLRERDIESDLRHRDFTINAIAVRLSDLKIIDPLKGQRDLMVRKLRLCGPDVMLEDALRVLRAFSISAQCGLTWTSGVESAVRNCKDGLDKIANERVNQELLRLFASHRCASWVERMFKSGVFPILVPEMRDMNGVWQGPYHHLDVLRHSFLTLERLEEVLSRIPRITRIRHRDFLLSYLNERIGSWPRRALLKWAALFHDIGKPFVREVREDGRVTFYRHDLVGAKILSSRMERLKFSRRQIGFVRTVVRLHMRPGDLTKEGATLRAVYRFFRQAEGEDLAVMLLSWADAWATRGRLNPWRNFYFHRKRLIEMINQSIGEKTRPVQPRLLSGYDVMKILSIPPGPMVGQVLDAIRERQFLGEIRSREEAERWLRNWWQEKKYLTNETREC